MRHILFCKVCKKFSMKEVCECGMKTISPKPPKYSPDDKYASYKRKAKEADREKAGLV